MQSFRTIPLFDGFQNSKPFHAKLREIGIDMKPEHLKRLAILGRFYSDIPDQRLRGYIDFPTTREIEAHVVRGHFSPDLLFSFGIPTYDLMQLSISPSSHRTIIAITSELLSMESCNTLFSWLYSSALVRTLFHIEDHYGARIGDDAFGNFPSIAITRPNFHLTDFEARELSLASERFSFSISLTGTDC